MSQDGGKPDAHSEGMDAALLESLAEAFSPSLLDLDKNERLLEQALSRTAVQGPLERASSYATTTHLATEASNCVAGTSTSLGQTSTEVLDSGSLNERQAAERLARALAGETHHPLATLGEVLRAAYAPPSIADDLASEFAQRALQANHLAKVVPIRVWSYAATALALAATVALWIGAQRAAETNRASTASVHLARSRSLSPLFAETLEHATPTQRIDRIYAVRSKELRHNRYATWRVR